MKTKWPKSLMEQAKNCTDLEEPFINFNATKEQNLLDPQQFIAMAKNGTQLFLPVSVSHFLKTYFFITDFFRKYTDSRLGKTLYFQLDS